MLPYGKRSTAQTITLPNIDKPFAAFEDPDHGNERDSSLGQSVVSSSRMSPSAPTMRIVMASRPEAWVEQLRHGS
jgi:hypothetical protein